MPAALSSQYAARIAAGEVERDGAQQAVVRRLADLEERLREHGLAQKSSVLGWMFGNRQAAQAPTRGLYIHGDVGRGKTMLMDMFFAAAPVRRKRRAHFHEFMLDVHERVHAWRQRRKRGEVKGDDPIEPVAAAIAEEASLLCFDEFHVTDIADAMILGRLFTALFARGVVVVATSNVVPDELYRDGLNRALFLPFLALLQTRMDVVRLDARTDFRLEKLAALRIWHVPAADPESVAALDDAWRRLTAGEAAAPRDLLVKGRTLHVGCAASGVARFTFEELCGVPRGAADYLRIAREFHTLVIASIPVMGFEQRNEAKRFITLIDTLYDNAVKLVASADAAPNALYTAREGVEMFEFRRTASRLIEMASAGYLALPHARRARGGAAAEGVVET